MEVNIINLVIYSISIFIFGWEFGLNTGIKRMSNTYDTIAKKV